MHTQTWDQPTIVLVRTGRFGRRVRGRSTVVDSTQGYIDYPGDDERIEHLGCVGHRCTALTLRPDLLPVMFRVRARLSPGEFRTSPAIDLAHRLLLAECRRGSDSAQIQHMAVALVTDLFASWAQSAACPHRVGTRAATRRVVDIARELVTTSSLRPSLRSVATTANVSPQYLTRVFRKGTGLTLSQYRNRVRVRLALEMLGEEVNDLKWIANDLGFFDRAHFWKVLMAEVGLPPHAVRRMLSSLGSSTLDAERAAATPSVPRSA